MGDYSPGRTAGRLVFRGNTTLLSIGTYRMGKILRPLPYYIIQYFGPFRLPIPMAITNT